MVLLIVSDKYDAGWNKKKKNNKVNKPFIKVVM